ncbi:MAG: hypothetical protein F7B06_01990 [Opitutae bacterium]|nr:hypothetical protein [Opitutae bacterium]
MKKPVPNLRVLAVQTVFVLAALLVSPFTLQASKEMDALLKVLLLRNIITQEDVDAIKAEAAAIVEEEAKEAERQPAQPEVVEVPAPAAPESPIQISDKVESVNLYANARIRYHHQELTFHEALLPANAKQVQRRTRPLYRLKLGSVTQFKDSPLSFGAQLETATTNDSTNADFGGFWDKLGGGINVGRLYLNYQVDDDFLVTVGKHQGIYKLPNMLWGGDMNPEGISETWTMGPAVIHAGQYLIDNENESKATLYDGDVGDDYMFILQAVLSLGDLTVAPLFMTSIGDGQSIYPERGSFSGVNSLPYFRNFDVGLLIWDYDMGPGKIFGALGRNFENKSLQNNPASPFYDATRSGEDRGNLAQLGYQHGAARLKGQSQWSVEYRYIEGAAYSPNLTDPDWSRGMLNQSGLILNYKYQLTDFLQFGATFMEGSVIDEAYYSRASGITESDLILLDAMLSF